MAHKGVSPLLTSVIIFGALVVSTMLVLQQTIPLIEKGKEASVLGGARQALSSIDSAIQELLYESPGASRVVNFKAPLGEIAISSRDDLFQFYIDTDTQIMEPGAVVKNGNMIETYGTGIKAYESDINNDGTTDLVLENEAILFAVRKIGNSTSYAFINTSDSANNVITALKNKRLGINMTPALGIYINNLPDTSIGTGYTELSERGDRLPSGTIKLYLASNANLTYEALFRLMPGQDYIQASIRLR